MSTAPLAADALPPAGPWARRVRSALRHPRRAFRESLAEGRRSATWGLVLVPPAAAALSTLASGEPGAVGLAALIVLVGVPLSAFATVLVATAAWSLGRWALDGEGSWHELVRALLWSRLPIAQASVIAVPLVVAASLVGSEVAAAVALVAWILGDAASWVLLVALVADAHGFSVARSLVLWIALVLSALALGTGLVTWVNFAPRALLVTAVVVACGLALAGTVLLFAACIAAFRGSR